ncbi:hypothetical protein KY360_05665 [Candidatus Woesearchaeota archaeon]|nr:hypothetical protein [Candidatus Woesearchaeota archaeon]
MVLWALKDNPEGTPTSGDEALRLEAKGETHTYYDPEVIGKEVNTRSGSETPLVSRRAHFFMKNPPEEGAERRPHAEVGRIGIEATLREAGDMYEVGRGRLFREWDSSAYSHKDRTNLDTGFDIVYARQMREGKAPIDYVVMVFDSVPNSKDYWNAVEACFKSGPKNGEEKYVIKADKSRTPSLGTGKGNKSKNGKVYVATVLIGSPDKWAIGSGTFVTDILMRTKRPINYYDLLEGAMTSIGNGDEGRKDSLFTLAPMDIPQGVISIGDANPKLNKRVGLAYFVDQAQKSLFTGTEGEQTDLF